MADFIIKKWNTGTSSFDELYPKTTHTQIVASGTPSSSTFLRGDGTWAVPDGVDNYVNITGDTMTGNLDIQNGAPTIKLLDTNGTSGYYLHANNSNFYVLKDTTSDGTYDSIPFILTNAGNIGIGTSSPAAKLDVAGSARFDGPVNVETNSTADRAFYVSRTGTTQALRFWTNDSTSYIDAIQDENTGEYGSLAISADMEAPDSYISLTGNTVRLNGNVGIGTTSPSEKLDIVGNIAVSGTVDGVDIAALDTTVSGKVNKSGDTMTGNLTISNSLPKILLVDTDHNSDFEIKNSNGNLVVADTTNSRDITTFHSNGNVYNAGQTISYGNITVSNTQPTIKLNDTTSGADDFFIYGDTNTFYITTDRDESGSGEAPIPLQLNNALSIGLVYGNEILTSGSTLPSHTHSASDIISGTLDAARLPSGITGLTPLYTGGPTLVTAGTATWTAFALGYTPAIGDKFLVVVSVGSSSSSIEKAAVIVEYGTFSSTNGMSLIGFMGYGGVSGGAVIGVNYGAQWQISSTNLQMRYPAQSAWNSTTISQITTFYVWAIYKVN